MDILSLKNKQVVSESDIPIIDTFDEALIGIEHSLKNLRALALETNFAKMEERQNYMDNVMLLKNYYDKAERIVRVILHLPEQTVVNSVTIITHRHINPKQLETWVAKLQANMQEFFNKNDVSSEEQLDFIRKECTLLDVIIKALIGKVYFTGCNQPPRN